MHGSTNIKSSTNIIRVVKSWRMGWEGYVARMGERRGAYRVVVGKPEGKRPLEKPRRKWESYIEMDLQEILCGEHGLDLLSSRLEQVAGSYEHGNEFSDFIKWFMHITLPFYLLSYPIAIEGYCDITMSVNMHALISWSSWESLVVEAAILTES